MRRIQFDRCGEPEAVLYLAQLPDQQPAPGEVAVQIRMRPVNPSDLAYIRGHYVLPDSYPATPGMEAVGIVTATGGDVTGIAIGGRCMIGRTRGTWAETMVVPATDITPVPDEIPDEIACQMHANPLTAWLLVHRITRPGAIVQTAAGSAVGRLVCQLGSMLGRRIINVVRHEKTADDLRARGAEHVVLASRPDWPEQVRLAAGTDPIIAAFDPVAGQTGVDLLRLLAPGGELVLYGALSGQPVPVSAIQLAAGDISVHGFWLAPWFAATSPADRASILKKLLDLFQKRQLDIPVAGIYGFSDFKSALRAAQAPGRLGKILIGS
jgi:NADPH:quinone reductase-like Zn-dependent oxidoreductase